MSSITRLNTSFIDGIHNQHNENQTHETAKKTYFTGIKKILNKLKDGIFSFKIHFVNEKDLARSLSNAQNLKYLYNLDPKIIKKIITSKSIENTTCSNIIKKYQLSDKESRPIKGSLGKDISIHDGKGFYGLMDLLTNDELVNLILTKKIDLDSIPLARLNKLENKDLAQLIKKKHLNPLSLNGKLRYSHLNTELAKDAKNYSPDLKTYMFQKFQKRTRITHVFSAESNLFTDEELIDFINSSSIEVLDLIPKERFTQEILKELNPDKLTYIFSRGFLKKFKEDPAIKGWVGRWNPIFSPEVLIKLTQEQRDEIFSDRTLFPENELVEIIIKHSFRDDRGAKVIELISKKNLPEDVEIRVANYRKNLLNKIFK